MHSNYSTFLLQKMGTKCIALSTFQNKALSPFYVLEVLFFLGMIGSAVVVFISFFEDGKELFGKD